VASSAGETAALVELNTDWLTAQRDRLQEVVLASSVSSRRLLPAAERPVRDVGEALFAALLGSAEVTGLYRSAAALAAKQGDPLRLVLRIDTPELAALPWETMYDQAAGSYVCRRHQLVRHVPVASVPAPLPAEPPLRVLGVISSPRELPGLDVAAERDQLGRALAEPIRQGLVELHWARTASWADLQNQLLDGEWHVLHFIGHGGFDAGRDEGLLALEGEDGYPDLVAAHRVVDLLRQARPMPRLVVLNSCSGAVAGPSDLFSSTAATLVRGGVSAVAAMQYEISDQAALLFARGFYGAIARGRGVDDAVSSGRVAILGLSDRTLEWVTPVLYLRGHESRLLTVPPSGPGQPRVSPAPGQGQVTPAPAAALVTPAAGQVTPAQPAGVVVPAGLIRGAAPVRPAAATRRVRRLQLLDGHTAYLTATAFSPDGTVLATASGDHTIRLWDVETGDPLHTLAGHDEGVSGIAFGPDDLLASVGGDRTLRVWNVRTGASPRVWHQSYLSAVAFSPDGTVLATAGWDGSVRLRDVSGDRPQRTFRLTGESAAAVAFSRDGSLLAAAGDDGTAQVWDLLTPDAAEYELNGRHPLTDVAFSPQGSLLAAAAADGTVSLWNIAASEVVRTLSTGGHDAVRAVAFSPDGQLLATAGEDRTVRLWSVPDGTQLSTVGDHDGAVADVAFSPDGRLLATAGADRTARLYTDLPVLPPA
jgi:WD40 repeat protein